MKLISCKACGLVYDQGVMPFAEPDDIWKDDYGFDESVSGWNKDQGEQAPKLKCSCGEDIFMEMA